MITTITVFNLDIKFINFILCISFFLCFLFSVEKHVSSTRFERICRALSPYCLQHVFAMVSLGGAAVYCYICLFQNFGGGGSFLDALYVEKILFYFENNLLHTCRYLYFFNFQFNTDKSL